jgi:hypothetical protein
MTLQNRVTPFGDIIAVPDRGTLMGNRGILHNDNREIVRNRESRRDWMICTLTCKGPPQTLMKPGSYTQLFFLDEATALSAGHRPCFTCRRDAFIAFKSAWIAAGLAPADKKLSVTDIDPIMHRDRMDRAGRKVTYRALASELPVGTMVSLDDETKVAWLVLNNKILRWSPAGYSRARALPDGNVTVLSPASTVQALTAGYVASVHPSARSQPDHGLVTIR